jgi:hypothetical protein
MQVHIQQILFIQLSPFVLMSIYSCYVTLIISNQDIYRYRAEIM